MVYDWKRNVSYKAQEVGEYIEGIEKAHGSVTPKMLLDESRSDTAYLHNYFDWNDTEAAEKYREDQARFLLRNLVVVNVKQTKTESTPPIRAFVSIPVTDKKLAYVSVNTAMNDKKMNSYVVSTALSELISCRNKYSTLRELSNVWKAIDECSKLEESEDEGK